MKLAFLLILFILALPAHASTISLEPGQSIQKAIDAASPGDIIEIQSGTYNESINITKSLILRGISGKDRTILFAPLEMVAVSATGIINKCTDIDENPLMQLPALYEIT